jgi:hypothetical protein
MKELLPELGFDPEQVERACVIQRGIGSAYLKMASEEENPSRRHDYLEYGASCLRKAASHAILIDDQRLSENLFNRCAEAYAQLRRPYAVMMWSLGKNQQSARRYLRETWSPPDERERPMPAGLREQYSYSLLIESVGEPIEHGPNFDKGPSSSREPNQEQSVRQRIESELVAAAASPTGILGIPVIHYLNLSQTLRYEPKEGPILENLFPFIAIYDLAIRTAKTKRTHWRNFRLPFHPVEPDILSVVSLANDVLSAQKISLSRLLDDYPISSDSRNLLQGALRARYGESENPPPAFATA